jgi:hypothetical protein
MNQLCHSHEITSFHHKNVSYYTNHFENEGLDNNRIVSTSRYNVPVMMQHISNKFWQLYEVANAQHLPTFSPSRRINIRLATVFIELLCFHVIRNVKAKIL